MKTTKRALLSSVVALILCFSMLVGTTFAWFTDEVTSANNVIVAGNLDIELYYQVEGKTDWTKMTSTSNIFMENAFWEPGHTEVVKLKIVNEGSLALKYQLGINVASETGSVNTLGDEFKLSDYIKFGIVDGAQSYTRDKAIAAVDATATALNTAYNSRVMDLKPKADDNTEEDVYTDIVTVVVYMPTTVGNEANHAKGAAQPTINLGINLVATQQTYENDSFDNQYDNESKTPQVDTITVPANNTADVVLSTENVNVAVPAAAVQAGDVYKMVVSDEKVATDDATGATTVFADVTLYKNDVKVSDGDTIYEVKFTIVKGATISAVTHNGVAMTAATTCDDQTYTYDSATGELTIYTKSFSPFAVTYTDFKDFVQKLNIAHTQTSYISMSTGSAFLPVAAVMPEITGYSVFDGDTRIANSVCFRFSKVEKQDIDENSYKVSFNLAIKDENGNNLELKPGMPSTINGKEYLHMYVNLLEIPEGYAVSAVKVNGTSFALTNNAGGNPSTGEYWIGSNGKDVYLQSMETGLFEIIVTNAN